MTRTAASPSAEAQGAQVFDRVVYLGDIGQPHRRAIVISDHELPIILGKVHLIIGVKLKPVLAVFNHALGAAGIGRGERGADVFEPDPIFE